MKVSIKFPMNPKEGGTEHSVHVVELRPVLQLLRFLVGSMFVDGPCW